MSATPALSTGSSEGAIGRVTIANAYTVAGPLGVTPTAAITVNGSDPAFQPTSAGTILASAFPGRVVAIGPSPGDYSGSNIATDSVLVRQHGAGTLTLPANPWDGMRVAIIDADGDGPTTQVEVVPAAGQLCQNPYNPATFSSLAWRILIPWQYIELVWDAVGTNVNGGTHPTWRIATDSSAATLPIVIVTNANITLVGRASVRATSTSSAVTVTLPSAPADGLRVRVKDVGGAAATHNITIAAAGAGISIEPLTNFTGGGGGSSTSTIAANYRGAEWEFDLQSKTWWGVYQL